MVKLNEWLQRERGCRWKESYRRALKDRCKIATYILHTSTSS